MSAAATPETNTTRAEIALFEVAVGLVALHAIVDSFLAPEPGTAWNDHLLRGGATLTVLGGAVALYPRLRAGARAALAAVLGVLSLEGAALAILDARAVGARGEDWTGFVLLPVGLVLCGLAATLVWRSRKPGRFRYLRRAGVVLGSLVVAYWVVMPLAFAIGATHRPRAAVEPANLGRPYEDDHAEYTRRSPPRSVVCPIAKRRRGRLLPDTAWKAAARSNARAPRLRRAAARCARLRRQRG